MSLSIGSAAMRELARLCVGCVVGVLAAGQAQAQSPDRTSNSDSAVCADGGAMASYARCALMLDGNRVRRGSDAIEVGRPGFFTPIPLERLVAGDTAKMYAARYARRTNQGTLIGVLGLGATVAGLILAHNESDQSCLDFICTTDDPSPTAATLIFGGAGLMLVSIPFQVNAQHAAARAVWWHNLRFGR